MDGVDQPVLDGCSAGDVELTVSTLHLDVIHWFLAPNTGSKAVEGAEHLARYWRKVTTMLHLILRRLTGVDNYRLSSSVAASTVDC